MPSTVHIPLGRKSNTKYTPPSLLAIVSARDATRVLKHKWHACINMSTMNGKWRSYPRWYVRTWIEGKPVSLHRFILNPQPSQKVDHADGDSFNCSRSNLRAATNSENVMNQKARSGTGFKGVYTKGKTGKFYASISIEGKDTYIGTFDNANKAASAYDKIARETRGKFARFNFPKKREMPAR
jgi:hypothetical protein